MQSTFANIVRLIGADVVGRPSRARMVDTTISSGNAPAGMVLTANGSGGVSYQPIPSGGPGVSINGYLFYEDTNNNLNIQAPDTSVITPVRSGMGPPLPPTGGSSISVPSLTINGYLIYKDTHSNLNIQAPDTTIITLFFSGMGPPLPP